MRKKYKVCSFFILVIFLFTSLTFDFYSKSYAIEQKDESLDQEDLSYIEQINEDYDLRLSDQELVQ